MRRIADLSETTPVPGKSAQRLSIQLAPLLRGEGVRIPIVGDEPVPIDEWNHGELPPATSPPASYTRKTPSRGDAAENSVDPFRQMEVMEKRGWPFPVSHHGEL